MCLSLSSSSSSSSVRRLRACTALVFTEDRNGPRPLLWAPPNNSKPTIKKQAIRRWERSMSPRRARQARRTRPRKREWGLGRPKCRTTEYQMSKPRRNQTPQKKKKKWTGRRPSSHKGWRASPIVEAIGSKDRSPADERADGCKAKHTGELKPEEAAVSEAAAAETIVLSCFFFSSSSSQAQATGETGATQSNVRRPPVKKGRTMK